MRSFFIVLIYFLTACESVNQSEDFIKQKAQQAKENKEYHKAIDLYNQVLVGDSIPDFDVLLSLGDCYLMINDAQAAQGCYRKALPYDTDFKARKALGRSQLLTSNGREAVENFKGVLGAMPNDIAALNGIGVGYDQIGDHKTAQIYYHQALQHDPNNTDTQSNLALSLAFAKDFATSLQILEKIGLDASATPKQRHNLALVYVMANRLDDAYTLLEKDLPREEAAKLIEYAVKKGKSNVAGL